MKIIGSDFHPSWQQIAWLDTETGETGEHKLVHAFPSQLHYSEVLRFTWRAKRISFRTPRPFAMVSS